MISPELLPSPRALEQVPDVGYRDEFRHTHLEGPGDRGAQLPAHIATVRAHPLELPAGEGDYHGRVLPKSQQTRQTHARCLPRPTPRDDHTQTIPG